MRVRNGSTVIAGMTPAFASTACAVVNEPWNLSRRTDRSKTPEQYGETQRAERLALSALGINQRGVIAR